MALIGKDELPIAVMTVLCFPLFFVLAQPDFFDWLHRWQTLLGALLALAGAGLTVLVIGRQIEQADRHKKDNLHRHYRALRATLPLTLSGLCQWSEDMAEELYQQKTAVINQAANLYATRRFVGPKVPETRIAEIQEFIRSTDDEAVIQLLEEVIRETQVLWARVADLSDPQKMTGRSGVVANINEWIVQSAQIYAMSEALFDYSRKVTASGPRSVGWDRIDQFLMRNKLLDQDLKLMVESHKKKAKDFWTI